MTAGALASHITDLIRFADLIFNLDEFDFDPTVYPPYQATSVNDLLKTLVAIALPGSWVGGRLRIMQVGSALRYQAGNKNKLINT